VTDEADRLGETALFDLSLERLEFLAIACQRQGDRFTVARSRATASISRSAPLMCRNSPT